MKYPALLSFTEVLPHLDQFDTIIDVRSPAEFAEDHIPGAINCPVLDNEERRYVGTLYKQVNSFEAKKTGASLVARNIARHIETLFMNKPRDWKPLIYCWRGGNRSGSMTHIFTKIGWPTIQLDGGYKEYRRHVNAALSELPSRFAFQIVCGTTGSGKSRLLQTLAGHGAQVLDLEQLASHRGSVLGRLPNTPQPTQKTFESSIWNTLRHFDTGSSVFVESESKKVGNLRVPDALIEKMRISPCISIELSQPDRIALLMQDYAHFVANPELLHTSLDCLVPLHGHQKITHWRTMASSGQIKALVAELLIEHYDPAYLRSIDRNFSEFSKARKIILADISEASFHSTAQCLQQEQ